MASRIPDPTDDQLYERHGRSFSAYGLRHNVYGVPIDHTEQQRIERLDSLISDILGGTSSLVPVPNATRGSDGRSESYPVVLDCGCGSGLWIERLLEEKSGDVDVTGVDICFDQSNLADDDDADDGDDEEPGSSGVQEYIKKRWNLNVPFREDRGEDRLRPETFDVINSRFLADGIDEDRWQTYVGDLRRLLKRGGWLQMCELVPHILSDNGQLSDDSYLTKWWTAYSRLLSQMGKNVRIGRDLARMMEREGFTDVRSQELRLPIGSWDRNQAHGRENRAMTEQMLVSLSLWPFTQLGRMSLDDYRECIRGAVSELRNDSLKLYYRLYIVRGRRSSRRR